MKNFIYAIGLLALAGCSSYSEIAPWDSTVSINDGETPLASFVTQNFSYRLFGLIPLASGRPWTSGDEWVKDDFDVAFFSDEATVDNNLVSLNHALDLVGAHRVTAIRTYEDDTCSWSLFLVNCHEVRTSCIILKD